MRLERGHARRTRGIVEAEGVMDESSLESELESEGGSGVVGVQKKKSRRFTAAQQVCLSKYWSNGQISGCGKRYSSNITNAARDTGLSVDQVKVRQLK